MISDPPRRSDNRCACGCGQPLPAVPKRRQRGIPDEAYLAEPFATSECCKAFHGVTMGERDPAKQGRPRAYAAA